MIAVDTSALMAIILEEPAAQACRDVLEKDGQVLISAGTLVEALIVSGKRGLAEVMAFLIAEFEFTMVPVTEAEAKRAAAAHGRWGRGVHPAGLNFGDCFAYAVARHNKCPLLFIGNDFSKTDIEPAIKQ